MSDQLNDNQSNAPVKQEAVAGTGAVGENSVGVTGKMGEATNKETETIEESVSFLDQLNEDLREEPSLKNFKDINDLAKSHVHAQRELGSRIRIPSSDASEEVRKEFDSKLEAAGYVKVPDKSNPESVKEFVSKMGVGRPPAPEQYVLNPPEGVSVNEEAVSSYKKVAHELGLSQAQTNKIFEFEMARATEAFNVGKAKATEHLKAQWGNEFSNKIELAKEVLSHYEKVLPGAVNDIKSTPTGNNPLVLIMAAELGKMYHESGVIQGNRSATYGLTPEEARSRINEIHNNTKHPYNIDSDPGHNKAVEDVEKLYKAAYPDSDR